MTEAKKKFQRNDRDGHLDPSHAASLRAMARETNTRDSNAAFVDGHHTKDTLAEELAEEAVESMTSGEGRLVDDLDADVPEELGGPFVTTTERDEMARGTDASNPKRSTREPFPRT